MMPGENHDPIKVTIADGRIIVKHNQREEAFHMKAVDTVTWESTNHKPFTIDFEDNERGAGDKSPFKDEHGKQMTKLRFDEAKKRRSPHGKATASVPYKYTVISDDDPNVKLDPAIIIDPPT